MDKDREQLNICPPCGENVPRGTKEGPNRKKALLAPPTPPNGGTPSTRAGDNSKDALADGYGWSVTNVRRGHERVANTSTGEGDVPCPLVRTHQHRAKKLQTLARNMRRHLTLHEVKLWKRLKSKQLGVVFHRQYLIANKYIADFVCLEKKLIIEVDGSQHCDNPQDVKRTEELAAMGFQIIRFWNVEIDRNADGCAQIIAQKLKE